VDSEGSILIVDDDPGVREALATALSTRYQVHTASTASAALDALTERAFDLILLDYRLPDLPGTSVLQAIKGFFSSIPVILMTGYGTEEIAVQALRGGARDYIRKPVNFQDLHSRVAALLSVRRIEQALPPPSQEDLTTPAAPWPLKEADLKQTEHGPAILRALLYMDENLNSRLRLADVARVAGMSKYHFCRCFRTCTGLYFREYVVRRRIAKAKELLSDTRRTVTDIFREVGFKDMTHFGRVFKKLEGKLPSEFRRPEGDRSRGRSSQRERKSSSD